MSAIAEDVFPENRLLETDPAATLMAEKKSAWRRFLSAPAGRCGLITYYARFGKGMLVFAAVILVSVGMFMLLGLDEKANDQPPLLMVVLTFLPLVGIIWFLLYFARLYIRRLHDLNLSAWFLLIFLIPVVSTIFFVYFSLVPGKEEDNRFGEWNAPTGSNKIFAVVGVLMLLAMVGSSVWAVL